MTPLVMTREAAVSALLGEVAGDVEADAFPIDARTVAEPTFPASEPEIDSEVEAPKPAAPPETLDPPSPIESESSQAVEAEAEQSPPPAPESSASPLPARPVMTSAATFYSPYAVRALGPLSGFGVGAAPRPSQALAVAANDVPLSEAPETPETPTDEIASDIPAADVHTDSVSPAPVAISADAVEPIEAVAEAETGASQQETALPLVDRPVEVPTFASPASFEVTPLALTGAPDAQTLYSDTRPAWPEHSDFTHPEQTPLFDPDTSPMDKEAMTESAARSTAPSPRFQWTETLTFLVMGVIGLLSFGAAMAAFRQSSQSNGETALIGWVLVVIALACVGVAGLNLYQRWGRADRP